MFPRFITLSASITTSLRVAVLTDAESAEAVMESPTALSGVSIVAEAVLAVNGLSVECRTGNESAYRYW